MTQTMDPSEVMECAIALDAIRQDGHSFIEDYNSFINSGLNHSESVSKTHRNMAHLICVKLDFTMYGYPIISEVDRITNNIEFISAKYDQLFK